MTIQDELKVPVKKPPRVIGPCALAVVFTLAAAGLANDASSQAGGAVGEPAPMAGQDVAVGTVTGFPIPRFVSIKASEANARRGPGMNFRIDWTFWLPGFPLEIIEEHGNWRKVRASDGEGGWMYHAMLSGKRTVEVVDDMAPLRSRPGDDKWLKANLMKGVVGELGKCTAEWCHVTIGKHRGWIRKHHLWGIDTEAR